MRADHRDTHVKRAGLNTFKFNLVIVFNLAVRHDFSTSFSAAALAARFVAEGDWADCSVVHP